MRSYVKYLRKCGIDINGRPNYISNEEHFDSKDYSIIHLGDGCTIFGEVFFLTHDYSMHTVLRGIKNSIDQKTFAVLEERDKKSSWIYEKFTLGIMPL